MKAILLFYLNCQYGIFITILSCIRSCVQFLTMASGARLSLQRCARYLGFTFSPSSTLRRKMTYFTATRKVLRDGVFPTMITPMNEDKSVDWTGIDRKCSALFVNPNSYDSTRKGRFVDGK